jgi:hypothetical protein
LHEETHGRRFYASGDARGDGRSVAPAFRDFYFVGAAIAAIGRERTPIAAIAAPKGDW